MNQLHLGDCLDVLREGGLPKHSYFGDESVDLVYIDPPFNSKRDYNIFFDDAQIRTQHVAFEDTWTLHNIASSLVELNTLQTSHIYKLLQTYGDLAPHAYPYLVMMSLRILELHRVLKPTGSFYLHCDPTMSHYLKTVCDLIFGATNFRSEIIWRRTGSHNKAQRWAPIHDVILFYTKSDVYTWNCPKRPYMLGHVEEHFVLMDDGRYRTNYYGNVLTGSGLRNGESGQPWHGFDPSAKGRHWAIPGAIWEEVGIDPSGMTQHQKLDLLLKEGFIKIRAGQAWPIYERTVTKKDGPAAPDIWAYQPYTEGTVFGTGEGIDADVRWLNPQDAERLKYPTQKPVALLQRIIEASTNPGDTVLDAFCGCGTAVIAAEGLHRNWIGIDISPVAIGLVAWRLEDTYKETLSSLEVRGIPTDYEQALELWTQNPNAFQDWWVVEYGALSPTFGKKGRDKGIDGLSLYNLGKLGMLRVAFQVKGGATGSKDMDALLGAMQKFDCKMGVFLTIEPPTKPMLETAAKAGAVLLGNYRYPAVQILQLKHFFNGQNVSLPPPKFNVTFASAKYTDRKVKAKQVLLEFE